MSEIEPGGGQPTIDEISEAWGVAIDMEGTPMAGSYLYELRQLFSRRTTWIGVEQLSLRSAVRRYLAGDWP